MRCSLTSLTKWPADEGKRLHNEGRLIEAGGRESLFSRRGGSLTLESGAALDRVGVWRILFPAFFHICCGPRFRMTFFRVCSVAGNLGVPVFFSFGHFCKTECFLTKRWQTRFCARVKLFGLIWRVWGLLGCLKNEKKQHLEMTFF